MDAAADLDRRFAAVSALRDEDVHRDLDEAARATGCSDVGMIGFCMGGMYCFKASTLTCIDRIVSFYGMITLPEAWRGDGHREPLHYLQSGGADKVLAIIGTADTWTPPADVAELAATGATVVRYEGAEHGFAHDAARPAHRADDAADAFARARQWLTVPSRELPGA
ncbi:MAG: dienelactone hydrolase family protein, partial [Ilumatobacteraceae bacterium]